MSPLGYCVVLVTFSYKPKYWSKIADFSCPSITSPLCTTTSEFRNEARHKNKRLSCRRETARCFRVIEYFAKSLKITQAHSK